jgi:transcription antitermination factor NusG
LENERPWYALYTRSRHEKRVAEALGRRGFDVYLPLVPRESQWHDRKKTVHWPLFPGYVFVRFEPGQATTALSVPGAVRVIGVRGEPAPIRDSEIENVRRFASCLAETGVVPTPEPLVDVGQEVVVQSGPFGGVRGRVLERRAAGRVLIQIGVRAIGQALKVELEEAVLDSDRTVTAGRSA